MQLNRMAAYAAVLALSGAASAALAFPAVKTDATRPVVLAGEAATEAKPDTQPPAEEDKNLYLGNEPLESCMKRWDPGTHMTKDAWRKSCQRITEERGPYVKGR